MAESAVLEARVGLQVPELYRDWVSTDGPVTRAVPDEQAFRRLADRWHDETWFSSVTEEITANENYRRIIEMGEPAIPWILRDLKERGGNWFVALHEITGASPVRPEEVGFPRMMKEAWLGWARTNGYDV